MTLTEAIATLEEYLAFEKHGVLPPKLSHLKMLEAMERVLNVVKEDGKMVGEKSNPIFPEQIYPDPFFYVGKPDPSITVTYHEPQTGKPGTINTKKP